MCLHSKPPNGVGLAVYVLLSSNVRSRERLLCHHEEQHFVSLFFTQYPSCSSKVPAFGPIVQELNMCLLDRDWKRDQKNFAQFLEQFEHHPRPVCVFLCPEGTTITQGWVFLICFERIASLDRSQQFARRAGRPVFDVFSSRLHARLARPAASLDRARVHHPANPRVGEGKRRDGLPVRHDDAVRRLHRRSERRSLRARGGCELSRLG